MKKSAIPVGGLYIVAFMILLGMAGMSLYLFINGQSSSSEYRIAAASILEFSEQFKNFVDQERRFVIETVLFFLGSQGGVENIVDFSSYNIEAVALDAEANACVNLLNLRTGSPSEEIVQRCLQGNSDLYNEDSEGIWKCDSQMYSYETCVGITNLASAVCCDDSSVNSYIGLDADASAIRSKSCHQGCLNALGENIESCSNLDLCGALFCKSNNLEIPETYSGVPYYYRIGETGPGYYCSSSFTYSPENEYTGGEVWEGVNPDTVINRLTELANNYFYVPSPEFTNYLSNLFDSDVSLTFQLDFGGCNNEACEFTWVPYSDSEQGFTARGFGGVEMLEFTTGLLSTQTIPIPISDMVSFSRGIITEGDIVNFLADGLAQLVSYEAFELTSPTSIEIEDWLDLYAASLGITQDNPLIDTPGIQLTSSVFDLYDNRYCGDYPYSLDYSYECLMQHFSNQLYTATSNPFSYEREDGYDYLLRPVFRFVETSLGTSIPITGSGSYELNLLPGNYNIFIKGSGATSAVIRLEEDDILKKTYSFSQTTDGEYYESTVTVGDIGRCAQQIYDNSLSDFVSSYGCCPMDEYNPDNTCNVDTVSNTYCSQVHNNFGRTIGGEYCLMSGSNVDYDNAMTTFDVGDSVKTLEITLSSGSIEYVDVVRISFDKSFNIVQDEGFNTGGSYEYYTNTKDCVEPRGEDIIQLSALLPAEVWYSVLCLRGQGYSWGYIMEEETGLFNEFINEASWDFDSEASKMDSLISTYGFCVKSNNGVPYLIVADTDCDGELIEFSSDLESEYLEASVSLDMLESVEERLFEIGLNTSYMSLPIKWVFAYSDQVMVEESQDCNLNYEEGINPFPDCSCKECEASLVCDFDFQNLENNILRNYLYNFDNIFINNVYGVQS